MSDSLKLSIFLATPFVNNTHYNQVFEKFKCNLLKSAGDALEKYNLSNSNGTRVEALEPFFEWEQISTKYTQGLVKDASLSSGFREDGYLNAKEGNYPVSLRNYNLAITFGPKNSTELALAFCSRSELLELKGNYQASLSDAEIALKLRDLLPPDTQTQISERHERLMKYRNSKILEDGYNFNDKSLTNEVLLGASDKVSLADSDEKGRHLVALEDIPAGSVLLRDKPYCSLKENLLLWETEHCSVCCKPISAGIPDDCSPLLIYCSETCKMEQLLTPELLAYLHQTPSLHDSLLTIQVILKSVRMQDTETKLSDKYDPSKYNSTYNLIQHVQRAKIDSSISLNNNEFRSIFLAKLIQELTPDKKVIPASLILRHLENLPYNVITLSTWPPPEGVALPYATGVFNLIALANSSCDPNAVLFKSVHEDEAYLIALQRIRKGEEITLTYKSQWSRSSVEERQAYLLQQYKFLCSCHACNSQFGPSSVKDLTATDFLPADLERVMDVQDDMEEIVELLNRGKCNEALPLAFSCSEFLSKFDARFRLFVLAKDLIRMILMKMTDGETRE